MSDTVPDGRPRFNETEANSILEDHYELTGELRPLPSYDDQNFHLIAASGAEYVLKISGLGGSIPVLAMENGAMAHLRAEMGAICPDVVTAVANIQIPIAHKDGRTYPVRLITWMPETVYGKIPSLAADFHRNLGRFVGRVDRALATFDDAAAHRYFEWDLAQAGFIRAYLDYIPNEEKRTLVVGFLDRFEQTIQPQLAALRHQIIHSDPNEYNVFSDGFTATGIIDFGDTVYSALVCEPAIAAAYASLKRPDPLLTAVQVIAGYHETNPLTEEEISLLFNLTAMRICVSVTMSSYNLQKTPENEYIQISAKPGWEALEKLAAVDPDFAHAAFRHGCGLETMFNRLV